MDFANIFLQYAGCWRRSTSLLCALDYSLFQNLIPSLLERIKHCVLLAPVHSLYKRQLFTEKHTGYVQYRSILTFAALHCAPVCPRSPFKNITFLSGVMCSMKNGPTQKPVYTSAFWLVKASSGSSSLCFMQDFSSSHYWILIARFSLIYFILCS